MSNDRAVGNRPRVHHQWTRQREPARAGEIAGAAAALARLTAVALGIGTTAACINGDF
jgi:hypothetical protein